MDRLTQFLTNSNFASRTKRSKQNYLLYCFNFFLSIGTSKDFLKIQPSEFEQLFRHVDALNILEKCKKRYRTALHTFSDYLCREIIANNQNPSLNYDFIFSNRFFQFRDSGAMKENHYMELKDILDLVKWARFSKPPLIYYAILILITAGCRIEGALTLTRDRIDFEHRKFTMLEKSRNRGSKIKAYVINKQIIAGLQQYISFLSPTQVRLFPISQQKFNIHLKGFKPWLHAQIFRDAFNTILEENDVEESIRDILQNRIPKSTNGRNYLNKYKDWEKRVKKYDKVDPFRGHEL